MVLITLGEITLKLSLYAIKSLFSAGYWIIYGTQKTKDELILEALSNIKTEQLEAIKQQCYELEKFKLELYNILKKENTNCKISSLKLTSPHKLKEIIDVKNN